jgi:hypothetical protein
MILVGSTVAGIGAGILGDLLAGDLPITLAEIPSALVLSPLAVTLHGGNVSPASFATAFGIGGLLFWPVYFVLAWRWMRRGPAWLWLGIFVWTAQGYYQAVHRLHGLMSV